MISDTETIQDPRSHGRYGRRGLPREMVDRIYTDYLRLKSVAKVGVLHGRTRQSIWEILKTRKLQLRVKRFHEKVMHSGIAYTPGKSGYLRKTSGDRRMLQHVVWEDAHGPIPEGHNILFKDGDRLNCAVDNLECLPIAEVSRRTADGTNGFTKIKEAARISEMEQSIRGLAFSTARKNFRFAIEVADLEQTGRIAVRDACRDFDPEKFNSFRAFAYQRAKWAMANFVKKHGRNVRAPANKFYSGAVSEISIHAPVGNDDESSTYEEIYLGADETTTAAAQRGDQMRAVARLLKRMSRRDAAIVRGRFFENKTLEQIGEELGVTKEAIRQRELQILARLRRSRRIRTLMREGVAA